MNETKQSQNKSLFANTEKFKTNSVKIENKSKEISKEATKATESFHNDNKKIHINFGSEEDLLANKKLYKDNTIKTTKFNIFTWIPLSLFFQFQRAANIYFLVISILTLLPFSPKTAVSMIGTFAVVLVFTMLKDGWEDLKRYQQDKKVNDKLAKVYSRLERRFVDKKWSDILVSDILLINKNEDIPADILFIMSSNEAGLCFVDTMSLDGETNLKQKLLSKIRLIDSKISVPEQLPNDLNSLLAEVNGELSNLSGSIECDSPNANLVQWFCSMNFKSHSNQVLDLSQLLLKGCVLRNTEFIIGMAVYTGHSTKIMKNAKKPPIKVSNVMKIMNYLLYSVFAFQQILCLVFAFLFINWQKQEGYMYSYLSIWESDKLKVNEATGYDWFIKYLTFVVAYSHMIPISLYVALELVKIIQSILVGSDIEMYDKPSKKYANARTSDLIEELGQVEFIFSDKTGTLTKNEMEFKKCDINFKIYGGNENNTANGSIIPETETKKNDTKGSIDGDMRAWITLNSPGIENGDSEDCDKKKIYNYFELLALCHSAQIEVKQDQINYQSSSPDEIALLDAAVKMGFKFMKRTPTTLEITDFQGNYQIYEFIVELPFDSNRKSMSVILKKNEQYVMYTKGADNVMIEKLNLPETKKIQITSTIRNFAEIGLRTLVMGKRKIDASEVSFISSRIDEIKTGPENEDQEIEVEVNGKKEKRIVSLNKQIRLSNFYKSIENKMEYVGSSAIEDKLQDEVAETIESLMDANIRIWVLTGDKKETALQIGKTCKLIQDEEKMEKIDLASSDNVKKSLTEFRKLLENQYNEHCRWLQGLDIDEIDLRKMPTNKKKLYIIIDGTNLSYICSDLTLKNRFFKIGLVASSVICCRMSPEQKSQVVEITKSSKKWITLSIGDGTNDVPMILKAHVGVGVSGKEGTEAVRNADYSISQFKFLRRLLLVHGRWGYRRISYFICYYFYKNIILVFTEFYFAIYNGFSGQIFFPDMLPLCYNAFWSSWPCIFNYSLEKDVDDKLSVKLPHLYKAGHAKFYFNMKNFWTWIVNALIHGAIIYFGTMYGLNNFISKDGLTKDHWFRSTTAFTAIMHVINYKIFINLKYWNKLSFVVFILSFIFYYATVLVLSIPAMAYTFNNELTYMLFDCLSYFKVWILIFCLPLVAVLPDMAMNWIQFNFSPSPSDLVVANPKQFLDYKKIKPILSNNEMVNVASHSRAVSGDRSEHMNHIQS